MTKKKNRYILMALAENKPGVMNRVTSLFRQRQFNIESMTAGYTEKRNISRMTMVVSTPRATPEQIMKQMFRIIEIVEIRDLTHEHTLTRELALVKIKKPHTKKLTEKLKKNVSLFKSKILAKGKDALILEISSDPERVNAFIDLMKKEFTVWEISRTGVTALYPNKPIEHKSVRV